MSYSRKKAPTDEQKSFAKGVMAGSYVNEIVVEMSKGNKEFTKKDQQVANKILRLAKAMYEQDAFQKFIRGIL